MLLDPNWAQVSDSHGFIRLPHQPLTWIVLDEFVSFDLKSKKGNLSVFQHDHRSFSLFLFKKTYKKQLYIIYVDIFIYNILYPIF